MREESRIRVFESRVQKKIFGPNRVEITRDGQRLHNEQIYDV